MWRGRHRSGDGACAGFTLIEALIALALVAILLSAIGAVVAGNIRGTLSFERHLALVETARLILATLPHHRQLAPGDMSGEFAGHRWRVDVVPVAGGVAEPVDMSPWLPTEVTIRVQSPSGATVRIDTVQLQRKPTQ